MALRGNHTLGGSQASENIAWAGRHVPPVAGIAAHDGLAMLQCISLTATHNIVGVCNASWGKFSLDLFKTLLHIVRQHWHAAALFLKLFAAS